MENILKNLKEAEAKLIQADVQLQSLSKEERKIQDLKSKIFTEKLRVEGEIRALKKLVEPTKPLEKIEQKETL